jgi:hypothetical protein
MTAKSIEKPGFHLAQRVRFVGGEGIVKRYKTEAETWIYLVEMELGPEPDFGRVGAETTIVLPEADLRAARY